ncbi:MAG TPA: NAD(P)H-dependent glycerol-3-phosphate dehydrogenase, partial [Fimbriimonadaceae bacterium]|nr:NAD(P)H-dependent glycerol-3-phosphate dehydrogenase [Fimbriimonadaceae bacterium]
FALPENIDVVWSEEELQPSDMWVIAVPSGAVRDILARVRGDSPLLVIASKGLETGTALLLKTVVEEALPSGIAGVLSGPNLAIEIVRGIPTVAVSAFAEASHAERVRQAFMCRSFRVYTSEDVVGVELAGALKNVLAIGAGLSDGLGFGNNTKGALLARGLHEMTSLGVAMGARVDTFMGIAGVGDLFATASSSLSRNYRVGFAIGQGESLADALEGVEQVAEGVSTSESALILARRHRVQMPVMEAIESVLRGRVRPLEAVSLLMERTPRSEGSLQQPC